MEWTEKQQCVLCDRGGNLLVCNSDGCPISVHKSCMGCKAYMDDVGNFYCPYCVYKRFIAEICKSREKAMLTKKNLSTFLEKEMKNINLQESMIGMTNRERETSSKEKLVDVNNLVCDDVKNHCVEKHQQSKSPLPGEESRDTFISEQTNFNTCRIMVLYNSNSNADDACGLECKSYKEDGVKAGQLESDVSEKTKVDNQTGNASQQRATSVKEKAARSKTADIGSSVEKEITHRKRKQSMSFKKSERSKRKRECMMENESETLVSSQNETQLLSKPNSRIDPSGTRKGVVDTRSINISNPEEIKDSYKQQSEPNRQIDQNDLDSLLDHPSGARKRSSETKSIKISNSEVLKDSSLDRSIKLSMQTGKKRVLWTEQEEDMLREGVHKFSSSAHKNLPWKKILDFGRHVFHPCRNPSDLKDKWRKIAK